MSNQAAKIRRPTKPVASKNPCQSSLYLKLKFFHHSLVNQLGKSRRIKALP